VVTSDAGLLAYRELDDALGLSTMAGETLADARTGKNERHALVGLLRQSVFGRLAGYEDVNDAKRLRHDRILAIMATDILAITPTGIPITATRTSTTTAGTTLMRRIGGTAMKEVGGPLRRSLARSTGRRKTSVRPFLADLDPVSGQPAVVLGWQFARFGWWGGAPRSEIAPSAGRQGIIAIGDWSLLRKRPRAQNERQNAKEYQPFQHHR